jgi:hypothetical protein
VLSFRFHIVSLIAVFLALAIGIAVGSTFIDRAIVDSLQDRVDVVSANLDTRRAENEALSEQIDGLEEYVVDVAPWVVEDRLNGRSILVVAERGIEDEPVEATVEIMRQAGADVPGIVWLEPGLALRTAEERQVLSDTFGFEAGDEALLQARLWRRLSAEDPADAGEALALLVDAGLAELDTAGGEAVEPSTLRLSSGTVVLVTGNESAISPDGEHVARAAGVLTEANVAVMAGEVYLPATSEGEDGAQRRGESLQPIVDDPLLSQTVSTDDALDLLRGRTSAVLVLDELAAGRVNHVGYGAGADGPVPPPGS